jgi:AcrR family transcriptional regulator
MEEAWRERKQQMVRDAIYGAAIELCAKKGFDETTVEEIAEAAGVSRRSFFRYFASKDDLLAQSVVNYGRALQEAVRQAPADLTQFELIEHTLMAGVQYTSADLKRTRQVVEIAARSVSARQAYQSRMIEVEDMVVEAFAERGKGSRREMRSRLMAGITLAAMSNTISSWYMGDEKDLRSAARQVLQTLTENLGSKTEAPSTSVKSKKKGAGKKS